MARRFRSNPLRRSGCMTCKDRHKKCDEQKPRCGNCVRRGLPCNPTELFRTSTVPHNGLNRRARSEKSSVGTPSDSPSPFALDGLQDMFLDGNNELATAGFVTTPVSMPLSTRSLSLVDLSPYPCATLSPQPEASTMERYLLHHYTFRMSSLLINVDTPSNPLRSVLLPRAVASPMLMDALYAVAGLHVFVGKRNPKFQIASLAYYDRAVSAFHQLITDIGGQTQKSDFEILLLTAVLLCKYEIISGGVSRWRPHLQGVKEMLDEFQRTKLKLAPETVAYVQSFITYHSYIATITQFDKSASPASTSQDLEVESAVGPVGQIDPYMGASTDLISLLHMAAETMILDPSEPSNLHLMTEIAIKIYKSLRPSQAVSTPLSQSDDLNEETFGYLNHIAEAYRHALTVYLLSILDRIEESNAPTELMLQAVGMRTLLLTTKEETLSACIREMVCVPDDKSCAVGLVPLLFIVGSETKDQNEFDFATERLTKVYQTACLGNIVPALQLLHKIRKADSTDWRQVLKTFHWDLIVV